jgi:hypothetical protein
MSESQEDPEASAGVNGSLPGSEWLRKYMLALLIELYREFASLGLLPEARPMLQALTDLLLKPRR